MPEREGSRRFESDGKRGFWALVKELPKRKSDVPDTGVRLIVFGEVLNEVRSFLPSVILLAIPVVERVVTGFSRIG